MVMDGIEDGISEGILMETVMAWVMETVMVSDDGMVDIIKDFYHRLRSL